MNLQISTLLFGLVFSVFCTRSIQAVENQQSIPELRVYKLDSNFYGKAEEWVLSRDESADDPIVKITIRGFLASLGFGPEMLGKATFQIDPRKNASGPLLYIEAPEDLLKSMADRHFQLTGTKVELLNPEDLKTIARLITERQKQQHDPFATE